MQQFRIKLTVLEKARDEDCFEPVYIDPSGLSRDDFLEKCGEFWDDVEEFANYREE